MSDRLSGGCLCGSVRFSARPENGEMAVCHCSMCRHWSGGAFMAVSCGTMDSIEVKGEDTLGVYKSSDYGERVFCAKCGSNLMWRMADGSHTSVAAQAFDDPSAFKFTTEIFVDEQPANYAFANDTRKMTGPEVFALFAQQQDPQHG
ncbi:GFA family protein [Roseibium aggregatum]|uniref:GFA family protein n=1 Tax=Roseibium aggregatum TaxID=187304 RepID=A0A939ECP8_9HYPH|nr:GFA family protein [Roseibium aggregatum]MBN9670787.1 GFA family protein [Roseibium aggregatum]